MPIVNLHILVQKTLYNSHVFYFLTLTAVAKHFMFRNNRVLMRSSIRLFLAMHSDKFKISRATFENYTIYSKIINYIVIEQYQYRIQRHFCIL